MARHLKEALVGIEIFFIENFMAKKE